MRQVDVCGGWGGVEWSGVGGVVVVNECVRACVRACTVIDRSKSGNAVACLFFLVLFESEQLCAPANFFSVFLVVAIMHHTISHACMHACMHIVDPDTARQRIVGVPSLWQNFRYW